MREFLIFYPPEIEVFETFKAKPRTEPSCYALTQAPRQAAIMKLFLFALVLLFTYASGIGPRAPLLMTVDD